VRIETHSERETELFGEGLAGLLCRGSVVGLTGPLGVGKTALVRGIARGLGVEESAVHSPTFLTAAEYEGRLPVAHIDLYRHGDRLPHPEWLAELLDGEGVALVEWYEHLGDSRPADALWIEMAYGSAATERRLEIHASGQRAADVVEALQQRGQTP
jgi:tRNA threonylcarbamoyladenosine biosynthesis protein TsaE